MHAIALVRPSRSCARRIQLLPRVPRPLLSSLLAPIGSLAGGHVEVLRDHRLARIFAKSKLANHLRGEPGLVERSYSPP